MHGMTFVTRRQLFACLALAGSLAFARTPAHAEQPFTRDLYSVTITPGIGQVLIQARDQKHGYGGRSIEVTLPARRQWL